MLAKFLQFIVNSFPNNSTCSPIYYDPSARVTHDVLRVLQSNYPARVKQLHIYNMGGLADVLLSIIKFCMSEKIQQRVN